MHRFHQILTLLLITLFAPAASAQTPVSRFLEQIKGRWQGTGQLGTAKQKFQFEVKAIQRGKFIEMREEASNNATYGSRCFIRADGLLLRLQNSGSASRGKAQIQRGMLTLTITGKQKMLRFLYRLKDGVLQVLVQTSGADKKLRTIAAIQYKRAAVADGESPQQLELKVQQLRLKARQLELLAAKLALKAQALRVAQLGGSTPAKPRPAPRSVTPPKPAPKPPVKSRRPIRWVVPNLVSKSGSPAKWQIGKGTLKCTGPASGFSMVQLGNSTWQDYAVEFELKVKKGSIGLFLRGMSRGAQFPNLLKSLKVPADATRWVKVRAVAKGGKINVVISWDNQSRQTKSNNTRYESGVFGFAAHAGAEFEVRGLRVHVLKARSL